jgi:hypothetical protein
MRIKLLQTVEDSNVFVAADFESGAIPAVTPYTLNAKEKKLGKLVVGLARVDKFPQHAEVDVPRRQAESLIALGYAELVSAPDEAAGAA